MMLKLGHGWHKFVVFENEDKYIATLKDNLFC